MKRYACIALLLALSFMFIGCNGEPSEEIERPSAELKKVVLGEFNTWGGMTGAQAGWASNGYLDENDDPIVSEYTLEDFIAAKFIVIDTGALLRGGFFLTWGNENEGWVENRVATDSAAAISSAGCIIDLKQDGGATITIDLEKAFGNRYNLYLSSQEYVRILLMYYGGDGPNETALQDLNILETYLLVDTEGEIDIEPPPPPPPPIGLGLDDDVGLGDFTIRVSDNEYGWRFSSAETDKFDMDYFRAASHLVLVTYGGGDGFETPEEGFNELSIVLQTSSTDYTNRTPLYDRDIEHWHTLKEYTCFVVKLDELRGYSNIIDGNMVRLILQYPSMSQFGLVHAYLVNDSPRDEDGNLIYDNILRVSEFEGPHMVSYMGNMFFGLWRIFGYILNYSSEDDAFYQTMKRLGVELPLLAGIYKFPDSGAFTEPLDDVQAAWGFGGYGGDLDINRLKAADYLVIETKAIADIDGFNSLRIIPQGSGNNYTWAGADTRPWGDWISLGLTTGETAYIVIELEKLATYNTFIRGNRGKLNIQYFNNAGGLVDLGITDVYLVTGSFNKDALGLDPQITREALFTYSNDFNATHPHRGRGEINHGYVTKDTKVGERLQQLLEELE